MDPKSNAALTDLPDRGVSLPLPTRSTFAYEQLREWIVNGDLEPGQKLDQESLAAKLSISRTPLRQALMRLEVEGLIEHRPFVGAAVVSLSLEDLEDIYATRGAIEAMLAFEATRRRPPDAVEPVQRVLATLAEEPAAPDFVKLDRRFHLAIYSYTGFRTALNVLDRTLHQSERYARMYARQVIGRRRSRNEHLEIFEAFRDGRSEDARELTARHIERGRVLLAELVSHSLGGIESAPED